MAENTAYTNEELAIKTLFAYYRVTALEGVLSGALAALPTVLAGINAPLTPEVAGIISDKLSATLQAQMHTHFLALLADDKRISEELKEELRKQLDGVRFEGDTGS